MTETPGEEPALRRARMVRSLRSWGRISHPEVLGAMGRVPREDFVPQFWASGTPVGRAEGEFHQWRVAEGGAALDLVYDVDLALGLHPASVADRHGHGPVTSTASAPRVVAWMLDLLDLRPGQRVLEVGTGSGYNAALLRELVGPEGAVTTIDVDATLAELAAQRLSERGYGDITVVCADGYFGLPARAPFDRVVATVGCLDVAPAWLEQLSAEGSCLLPLQHGTWHPLARLTGPVVAARGRLVGRTSFVGIQGRQALRRPWPAPARHGPEPVLSWSELPAWLAGPLAVGPAGDDPDADPVWDLAFLVALEEHGASFLRLAGDGSVARLEPLVSRVGWGGPRGPELADRLLDMAERWVDLGCPTMADYQSTFTPLAGAGPATSGAGTGAGEPPAGSEPPARWVVDRVDFRQTLELAGRA
jgi:protein-L-isoaspartate(D-aspartate) O-methyltransferase